MDALSDAQKVTLDIADEMTSWALQRMTSSRTDKTMMIAFAERLREAQKSPENQALRVI